MTSSDSAGSRKRWSFNKPLLAVGASLFLVIVLSITFVITRDWAPQSPITTSQPAAPSMSPTPSPSDDNFIFELFDDFSGSAFDSSKWEGGAQVAPLIYLEDGSAHIQAPPSNPAGTGAEATLLAKLPRPVSAVRFEMALLSADGPNDGGAYVVVSRQAGRNHKVVIGPDSQGFPGMDYYICARNTGCPDGVYESFAHPPVDFPVQRQQRYQMEIFQSERGWVFEVDGKQQALADLERGPIRNLSLYLHSSGEGAFHATVDDIFVAYAG